MFFFAAQLGRASVEVPSTTERNSLFRGSFLALMTLLSKSREKAADLIFKTQFFPVALYGVKAAAKES